MTAVPSLSTAYTAGQRFRATDVNTTNTAVNFANAGYACRVYNPASQTGIVTATLTTLLMPSESSDAYSWHSTSVNTGRITPTYAGWYLVTGNVAWDTNATGTRRLDVALNGVSQATVEGPGHATIAVAQSVTTIVSMNGTTDYVSLIGYQTSGGNLATNVGAASTWLTAVLLGGN